MSTNLLTSVYLQEQRANIIEVEGKTVEANDNTTRIADREASDLIYASDHDALLNGRDNKKNELVNIGNTNETNSNDITTLIAESKDNIKNNFIGEITFSVNGTLDKFYPVWFQIGSIGENLEQSYGNTYMEVVRSSDMDRLLFSNDASKTPSVYLRIDADRTDRCKYVPTKFKVRAYAPRNVECIIIPSGKMYCSEAADPYVPSYQHPIVAGFYVRGGISYKLFTNNKDVITAIQARELLPASDDYTITCSGENDYYCKSILETNISDHEWDTASYIYPEELAFNLGSLAPPTELTVPITSERDGGVTISWDGPLPADAYFVVEHATDAGFTDAAILTVTTNLSIVTAQFPQGIRYFRIKIAKINHVDSIYFDGSNPLTVTIYVDEPTNIIVPPVNDSGVFTVSWDASATPTATYVLERSLSDDFLSDVTQILLSEISYENTGLLSDTYHFRVKAVTVDDKLDSGWEVGSNPTVVNIAAYDDAIVSGGSRGDTDYRSVINKLTVSTGAIAAGATDMVEATRYHGIASNGASDTAVHVGGRYDDGLANYPYSTKIEQSVISTGANGTNTGDLTNVVSLNVVIGNGTGDVFNSAYGEVAQDSGVVLIELGIVSTGIDTSVIGSLTTALQYSSGAGTGINDVSYYCGGYNSGYLSSVGKGVVSTGAAVTVTTANLTSQMRYHGVTSNNDNDIAVVFGGLLLGNIGQGQVSKAIISTNQNHANVASLAASAGESRRGTSSNGINDTAFIAGGLTGVDTYHDSVTIFVISTDVYTADTDTIVVGVMAPAAGSNA